MMELLVCMLFFCGMMICGAGWLITWLALKMTTKSMKEQGKAPTEAELREAAKEMEQEWTK